MMCCRRVFSVYQLLFFTSLRCRGRDVRCAAQRRPRAAVRAGGPGRAARVAMATQALAEVRVRSALRHLGSCWFWLV